MNPWANPGAARALLAGVSLHDVGADPQGAPVVMAPVFPGWNVWAVWQKKDLDFELTMVGLDRDRRLRIWVENQLRAAGADVFDDLRLRGSLISILNSAPTLAVRLRKEQLASVPALDDQADLRFVRFYNRGPLVQLPWPYDDNYLLDRVYEPDAQNPATQGPPPETAIGSATGVNPGKFIDPIWIVGGLAAVGALVVWKS